ncbi:unnamed protein product [Dracunculus medinensis]|uniref:ribonuclease H n=1 Tax=Dracunculus medinensis TaxID=318479 RepID=A0A0N4URM4_DRAME|nr:unnamed protein product [Dracunculus medinensis]
MKNSYYAVANGYTPGIYSTWKECEKQIKGFRGARLAVFFKFKKTLSNSSQGTSREQTTSKRKFVTSDDDIAKLKRYKSTLYENDCANKILRDFRGDIGAPIVYTDGACSANGRRGAKAGIGVFWGDDHPDNIAEPLKDGPPTNNRAELMAVIVAVKQAVNKGLSCIIIRTDSNLLIQSMNNWIKSWRLNGWKTANGQDVKNKDLIVELDKWLKRVRFEHVAGHAGIYGNEKADELARKGAALYNS